VQEIARAFHVCSFFSDRSNVILYRRADPCSDYARFARLTYKHEISSSCGFNDTFDFVMYLSLIKVTIAGLNNAPKVTILFIDLRAT